MTRPNLVNIETLIWIHRLGSLNAAAEKLHTTQPAISARMRELESNLGFELFERRGRSVKLTAAARRFVTRVEPIVNDLESALFDEELKGALAGQIRMGVGEIAAGLFADAMPELRTKFPRVSYELELDLAERLRLKLQQGMLDISFVLKPAVEDGLVYRKVASTKLIWVTSKKIASKIREGSFQSVAKNYSIWCPPSESWATVYQRQVLLEQGLQPEAINTCSVFSYIIQFLLRADAIASVPEITVAQHMRDGTLESFELPGQAPPIELYLAWPKKDDKGLVGAIGRELEAILHTKVY